MTLKVVGSGFGRTGTMSLKLALEQLGVGRCYHMMEVFGIEAAPQQWLNAANGKPDWPATFEGFSATVDWPSATFYRELADYYPDAKVIHTERPSDEWFESTQATIFGEPVRGRPTPGVWREMVQKVVYDLFDGRLHDREHAIGVYERHNEAVRRNIPEGRLLIYEVSQGWAPLCAFLGAPEPAGDMIKVNTREQFQQRSAAARAAASAT
jgi:hypothetical protein